MDDDDVDDDDDDDDDDDAALFLTSLSVPIPLPLLSPARGFSSLSAVAVVVAVAFRVVVFFSELSDRPLTSLSAYSYTTASHSLGDGGLLGAPRGHGGIRLRQCGQNAPRGRVDQKATATTTMATTTTTTAAMTMTRRATRRRAPSWRRHGSFQLRMLRIAC